MGWVKEMGMMNLLKEFGALLWRHPLSVCCFLVLFTPPFFPVLRFFSPLLISTALFMVAIVTIGPDLQVISVDSDDDDDDGDDAEAAAEEEKQLLIQDSQVAVLEDELTLVVQQRLPNQFEEHGHNETWLVTKAVVVGKESGKSKWRSLRRIYKEKGIDWIENLFRNEDWMGPRVGLNDEQNVSILQEAFPQKDQEDADSLEMTTTRSIAKGGDGGGGQDLPEVLPPPLLLSDREFPKEFAAEEAPAVDALAVTNFDMPALETGDEEDEDEQYGEGYESGDGYDELGHSDLETGSPIQGDLHEELQTSGLKALIHAPTLQEHEIPPAAGATSVPLEQHAPVLGENDEVRLIPPDTQNVKDGAWLAVGIHEEESSVTELEDLSVVSNREFNKERSLPATEICKERKFLPLTQIPEEKSHLTGSEFGEEQQQEETSCHVSGSVISTTDEETQLLLEKMEQLPNTTADSLSVTKIPGDPCLVEEEVLSFASTESHKKPLAPRTDTDSISVEAAPSVATHSCEEKLISAIVSEEETESHDAAISQLHLPVAETMSIPATDSDNYHISAKADDANDDSTFNPSVISQVFNNAADEAPHTTKIPAADEARSHTIKIPAAEGPHDHATSFSDTMEQAAGGDMAAMVNSLVQTFRIASHEPKLIEIPA